MSNLRDLRVRIENPPVGFRETTSLEHARRFVRKGRAKLIQVGETFTLHFLDEFLGLPSVKAKQVIPGGEYDRVNRSFHKEAPRLPLIAPGKMIREEKSSRDWSYTAAVRRRLRLDHTAEEMQEIRQAQTR